MVIKSALIQSETFDTLLHIFTVGTGSAHSGQISLYVSQEYRYSGITERFCQYFQGNGFTGSRGTGNQAVAVGHFRQDADFLPIGIAYPDFIIVEHSRPSRVNFSYLPV